MSVDYDLVVIGAGDAAISLVTEAAQRRARVALVLLPAQLNLQNVANLAQVEADNLVFLKTWRSLQDQENLSKLQALGIDLITEGGKFSSPRTFVAGSRELKARAYAIAQPLPKLKRRILGIEQVELFNLGQMQSPPRSLLLVGHDAFTCTLAQSLARLGIKIRLLVDSTHILPQVDVEVARFLQAQLEAEGIRIYTNHRVTAIERDLEKTPYRVWAGERHFDCEQIYIPAFDQADIYAKLNLAAARIPLKEEAIALNPYLQTRNRRIYWCENRADVPVILQNVLFFRSATSKAILLSTFTLTSPPLASLGMTEKEAQLQVGKDVFTIKKRLPQGLYKLICRRNGEILGIHVLGDQAREIVQTLAIAMQSKLKIQQLECLFFSQDLGAVQEMVKKFGAGQNLQNLSKLTWLDSWFNFRRDWNW